MIINSKGCWFHNAYAFLDGIVNESGDWTSGRLEILITGLITGDYTFQVSAINSSGEGPLSEPVSVTI